jgi:superfamily II DNA or RNA helicase
MPSLFDPFDPRLEAAATQLIANGGVTDVRILQGGGVVTGVVGKHRVYIRRLAGSGKIEGECNCNERSPCVHVAAVVIAAEKNPAAQPSSPQRGPVGSPGSPVQQQRLLYLLKPKLPLGIQVDVFVGQPGGAQPFAFRSSLGGEGFPRYVEATDKLILKELATGEPSNTLLQQVAATGRGFWSSLRTPALRIGPTRSAPFAWHSLPNGDQELCCEVGTSVNVVLDADSALYIDSAGAELGPLESIHPLSLVRQYWGQPPIRPENIETTNERLALEASFPRLLECPVQKHALATLTPQLTLVAGPEATVQFVYNGLPVDSGRLQDDHASVRQLMAGVLYEIPRDLARERQWRARLAQLLPAPTDVREVWLAFMLEGAPALQAEGWSVSTADDFPYRLARADDWYGDLENDRRQGWFNLRLGVVVSGQHVNLLPALARYLQTTLAGGDQASLQTDAITLPETPEGNAGCRVGEQWLVLLDDGRYLPIAVERIQRIANTLVELFDRDGLTAQQALSLPKSHTGRITQLARELNGPALRASDASLQALLEDLDSAGGIQPQSAPADFRATLRPYQEEGLGWLQFLRRHSFGGVLADDMGLGKTVQTLAHLDLEKQQGRLTKPVLIVAPVSTLSNWQQEVHRFAPHLEVLLLHGSRRKESFSLIDKVDVVVTGYSLLQLDSEVLLAREYYLVILDEAQTIKNPRAKVSIVARQLRAEHRLALTGTPVENHLGELWSLFDFVQPGLLRDERHFSRHYRTPIEKDGNRQRAQALAQRLAPFLLRRTKDAVAKDLPPKTEIVETLAFEDRQRDFYDGIRLASHRRIQEVIRQQGLARSQITILDALLKLRQACCDPRLLDVGPGNTEVPSAKLEWLATVLPELIAEGRRILVFSQFTSMLRLIEKTVTELGIPYCLLTGETQNRADTIARFQSGQAPLFLISLKAGGTGLNLTAADTVIHYDPWWNPAVEAQATDRAHRIGQDKPVFVYKLIAQDTVEERIMQLQADKHELASRLYTEGTGSPAALTSTDIEALFAPRAPGASIGG